MTSTIQANNTNYTNYNNNEHEEQNKHTNNRSILSGREVHYYWIRSLNIRQFSVSQINSESFERCSTYWYTSDIPTEQMYREPIRIYYACRSVFFKCTHEHNMLPEWVCECACMLIELNCIRLTVSRFIRSRIYCTSPIFSLFFRHKFSVSIARSCAPYFFIFCFISSAPSTVFHIGFFSIRIFHFLQMWRNSTYFTNFFYFSPLVSSSRRPTLHSSRIKFTVIFTFIEFSSRSISANRFVLLCSTNMPKSRIVLLLNIHPNDFFYWHTHTLTQIRA